MNPDDGGRYLERVLEGDVDAFRFIVRQYQHMAFSIAISMVKEQSDADDVVQNSFIRAYKSIRSFRGDSKFSSWLYKIVVNEALKFLKKAKRHKAYISIEGEELEIGSQFNEAVAAMDMSEMKASILEVLDDMKPKEALILKLHYLHELSIKEIEASTGFSQSNIKVLLYRSRKSFMGMYLQLNEAYKI